MVGGSQISLFEDAVMPQPQPNGLLVVAQPGRPLSKVQRTFNRLVAKIETLHVRLRERTRELDDALAFFAKHVHPRRVRLTALRKELVTALAPFLDGGALRKNERKTLKAILAEQLDMLREEAPLDDALCALFQRVHGISVEDLQYREMEGARDAMEELLGSAGLEVDLSGFRADMTEEAFAAEAAKLNRRLQEETEAQERFAEQRFTESGERRRTKRQLEKEERMRQAEVARKRSIGSIYKQLARALHPDLEQDPQVRERKHSLMQQLTSAYRDNDLHTLLRLELEWIEREKVDVQRLTDEKLRIYNEVLKEQVADLEDQINDLPLDPRYQAIVESDGPFTVGVLDGPREVGWLKKAIKSFETSLARLHSDQALLEVRESIHDYRAANRRSDHDWIPF